MDPIVVDEVTQTFDGKFYFQMNGRYFRRRKAFLHRDVWTHHNGPIPPKHHVHHIDGNPVNNALANLEVMEGRAHLSMHQKGHGRRPDAALAVLPAWRESPEGRAHQSEMGKRNAHFMLRPRAFSCEQCGAGFETHISYARFCSNRCKCRWRVAQGLNHEERTCTVCGSTFSTEKARQAQTCSPQCRGVISGNARRGKPQNHPNHPNYKGV
jgi:predicted nucleic acid-binding Zn ribbon protein